MFSFYFTKESNMHCLHALLRHSLNLPDIGELDYLAQVELEVWKRAAGIDGHSKCLRVGVRQGAHLDCLSAGFSSVGINDHALKVSQRRKCTEHVDYNQAIESLNSLLGSKFHSI
jgi:hypothetical protein